MKIIIAGAGEVGTHLSKLLSLQHHDITLMDENPDKLRIPDSTLDIFTVVGSPSSINSLQKAGIGEADLFVAVTPDECTNLTASMLAKSLGAKKTIARINNYEYLLPKHKDFFNQLGVNSLIYPEMLAAKEILSAFQTNWVRQWFEIGSGALIVIGTKIRSNAPILNTPLKNLQNEENRYHIVGIKRGIETIIPCGNDMVLENDIVYFTLKKENIDFLRKLTGKESVEIRNVMFMGASRITANTIQLMSEDIQVKVIDMSQERCEKFASLVNSNAMIIHGDGRDMELLHEEGIKSMDAFIALTGSSEANILACSAAKRCDVKKTIAEVENNDYISLAESLDIGAVINKKLIAASHIYQHLLTADVSNVKCLTFADADVAEFIAQKDSKITQKPIKDLSLPKNLTIGGVIRQGVGIIVSGNSIIEENDHIVVFCLSSSLSKIEKYFK